MSDTRHTPTRMCRVCRTCRPKQELERWVLGPEGLTLDTKQIMPGRGYYCCRSTCSTHIHSKVALKRKEKH